LPNGPAIKGGCVTRRQHRAGSWYPAVAGPESCLGARRVWRTFCRHGTSYIEHYECRGTRFIGASKLSRYRIFFESTGAVSRYNLSRSQKFIKVQNFNCVQMRVSRCNGHYEFILGAVAKAKSVTNNLPLLSVLCLVLYSINIGLPVGYLTEYIKLNSFFSLGANFKSQVSFPVVLSILASEYSIRSTLISSVFDIGY
jgi:hypothetical protein